MEMYIEQGESRMDCELKIASKYKRPFQIISQKEVKIGGIFGGLFSKPGIQVEFYFSPLHKPSNTAANSYHPSVPIFSHVPDASLPMYGRHGQYTGADNSGQRLEEVKKKVLAAAGDRLQSASESSGREASQQILDALKDLKEKVENNVKKEEHPAFVRAAELLRTNDFSENYINRMLERLRKELPLEQLENPETVQDHLLEWIGESINIYREGALSGYAIKKPRIMVLIGPTGVGKTTTLSKLAAIYGIGTDNVPAIDVRMITIDAYRIGAKDQLEKIWDVMQIPVSCVVNKQDLRREIALYGEDTDLFLIDTIGKSPKDSSKLGEMKEILDGLPRNAEFHLVISAGTKASDIESIIRQFEPFDYKSLILSKMDETTSLGNIISALAEKKKCISYITDGQEVPVHIRRASVVRFLMNLDGFRVNQEKIENRFPSGEADQFKWK